MPDDPVLSALRRKLVAYEGAGRTDLTERVKARIAEFDEPADEPAAPETEPVSVDEDEPQPSMAMSKAELVDLAADRGLGGRAELDELTKQELVDELKDEG